MNVYMPGVTELGMVWVDSGQPADMNMGLLTTDANDMMLDQDSSFFPSSQSNHSLEDVHHSHHSPMEMGMIMDYEDMKQESSDGYMEDDTQPVYMMSTATQTIHQPTRKIKPVKHPGLVLKTPIAYQSDTDPSVIPIQKDGIAVCEKCGAIGVKHAFYTRERRFCSMACARGYSGLTPVPLPTSSPNNHQNNSSSSYADYKFKLETEEDYSGLLTDHQPFPQIPQPSLVPFDESVPCVRKKTPDSYDWDPHLSDPEFFVAPVSLFKHAPIADIWDNIMVGMKVEVENTDCDNFSEAFPDSFWVATVMKIVGYKALMRYEGFGTNCTKDFWVSLCSNQVHPVGWCATRGKPLIPPKTIENKYNDWKDFLCKRLTGARTLPSNFSNKVSDNLKSRFQVGLNVEVVDKNRISQVKVAMVHKIIGKRLNVRYYDLPPDDPGFWCHEDSPLLHPVGWAKKVGHKLVAPVEYLERVNNDIWEEEDATDDLFIPCQVGFMNNGTKSGFSVGMKLEAVDPLNLSSICVATVMDVLNYGYIMVRIDTYESEETGADWFCYHTTSPCIFPVGFCHSNNIPLTPPFGYTMHKFNWQQYLNDTHFVAASGHLFHTFVPPHGFQVGMKLEAADLMESRLVCVATISKVVGRLLRIHFDGWEEEYDQWLDCESPDIYPVGWCQVAGHKLEGPRGTVRMAPVAAKPPKVMKKRGRRRKHPRESPQKKSSEKLNISSSDRSAIDDDISEPETGVEVSGPDQSLPVSTVVKTEPSPTIESKTTSNIITTTATATTTTNNKIIPRLVDSMGASTDFTTVCPNEWTVNDVAEFLKVNDCANYCEAFLEKKIDGKTMLILTSHEIINFTGMKVGPSLKIYDLIQQLKSKTNPSQSRHLKGNIKRML